MSGQAFPEASPVGASRLAKAHRRCSMQVRRVGPPGRSLWSVVGAKHRGRVSSWSSVMSRFISIFLPQLAIERLKRDRAESGAAPLEDDRPFALVGSEERGLMLTAVNAASLSQGLYPGLGL